MKKSLQIFLVCVIALISVVLTSCSESDADSKVNAWLEQINSEQFKEQTQKSGVFTDSEAKVEEDADALVLTFKTIPGLSFKRAPQELMDAQKEGMMRQIKSAIPTDKIFREGFEGLQEKGLVLRITFLDTNGDSESIDIAPAEVLD